MEPGSLERIDDTCWRIPRRGDMRVPGIIYADRGLVQGMDEKVYQQVINVACLPGIVEASYTMPDAHWGYGFPIGGVAAFDPAQGGVVSAGGVGFDISCGVRTLTTGMPASELEPHRRRLADVLFTSIPAGVGSTGRLRLSADEMDRMLRGGARWAVQQGHGDPADLERTEENGCMAGADPDAVSELAKRRQRDEMGTLGSGNHYLEVQEIAEIFDLPTANVFGLRRGDVVISIHCGSRGLGHQIGTEFLREMALAAPAHGIHLPDRELACAPIESELGQRYLGAMRAGINCALANRQILTELTRRAFRSLFPETPLEVLYDVSHNTCKAERHEVDGEMRELYVHRKGATRAFPPGHPALAPPFDTTGQPVLIGGSMGTASYILAGMAGNEARGFSSACHGAGRAMSRRQATRRWRGEQLAEELERQGTLIRSVSWRGIAEEAPGAYKDVSAVVSAAEAAGLARRVARLRPLICIKG